MADRERWQELWKRLNGKTEVEKMFRLLAAFYSEPYCAYHIKKLMVLPCCTSKVHLVFFY
jgi:hypothetical protein